MNEWRVEVVVRLMLEAGKIARSYVDKDKNDLAHLKSDQTVVTEADIAVERYFSRHIEDPSINAYLIGEETNSRKDEEYLQLALRNVAWVLDPIDGTLPYYYDLDTWGISLGYMEQSRLIHGAIFMPTHGRLALTDGAAILYADVGPDCSRWAWDAIELTPLRRKEYKLYQGGIISAPQEIAKRGLYHGTHSIQAVGSCVHGFMNWLLGRYVGCIITAMLWDVAGSLPILERANASLYLGDAIFDGAVNAERYHMEEGAAERWKIRGLLLVANSDEECRYILRNMQSSNAASAQVSNAGDAADAGDAEQSRE